MCVFLVWGWFFNDVLPFLLVSRRNSLSPLVMSSIERTIIRPGEAHWVNKLDKLRPKWPSAGISSSMYDLVFRQVVANQFAWLTFQKEKERIPNGFLYLAWRIERAVQMEGTRRWAAHVLFCCWAEPTAPKSHSSKQDKAKVQERVILFSPTTSCWSFSVSVSLMDPSGRKQQKDLYKHHKARWMAKR